MNPKIRDTLLNAFVCFVFAMLLLHVLDAGTIEVPMPANDTPVHEDADTVYPFA